VDLIAPGSRDEVAAAVAAARAGGRRLLPVGGRTHLDKGNPSPVDAELELTGLDRLVDYHPEEMLAVVEAGMRCGRLDQVLAEQGQEWPVDAPERATVGGVIAAAASSPRRLAVGPVRDLVLEVELVTGDGRRVRAGGRTVKNVSGYDLCRLVTGSLGTLGVIVQVALKLRPLPRARRTIVATGGPRRAAELLRAVPLATAALVTPDGVELRLEGWPTDVEEQTDRAVALLGAEAGVRDDVPFPAERVLLEAPVVVEAAVAPSRLPALVEAIEALADGRAGRPGWAALAGVGACWIGLGEAGGPLERLRTVVAELGGIAPVVRGPGGHRLVRGLRAVPAALPDLPAHRRGVRVAARAYRRHARRLRGPGRGGRALHGVHGPVPFVPCLRGRVPLARALRPHDGAGPLPGRAVAAGAAPPGALARPGGRATARLAAHPGDGAAAAGQAAATRPRARAAPPRAAA
jgi:glycolate oxidase FAD binding subunit